MKELIRLTAWNWQQAGRWRWGVALAMTLAEAAALGICAFNPRNATASFAALFTGALCPLLFMAAYLVQLAVSLRPLWPQGRSTPANTWLMLELPRWQLLTAQVLASAVALLCLMAWQIILALLLYWPATALQMAAGADIIGYVRPAGGFWWAVADNYLLRLLLPRATGGIGLLVLLLAAPAILGIGVLLHKGWQRVAALVVAMGGAGCCAVLAALQLLIAMSWDSGYRQASGILRCVLIGLLALCWLWNLRALHRAEPAG